jgi:hypothetical protein
MEYITIFGSCRQTPIKDYLQVSNILDELNYPHYTKEILQQIRYLKYKNIPNNLTKYCFRSSLLNRCQTEISNDSYNKLKNEFDRTSFFLVEIASRISYKYNNLYLHHIAEESQYNFFDRDKIIKEDLTDEEIENDIIQIRNELYPKPFIILSHFATYESGKRYELIKLLENICKKFNIPFINQSNIIKKYGNNIILNEPVLAHYTKEGLSYVGKIILDKINDVKNINKTKKKILHQVYYTSEERVKKQTFHGFGDYIRGTIHLYQLIKDKNIELKVNFSNHHLSNIFICDNHLNIKECENTKYIFGTGENFLDYSHVFTNNFEFSHPDKDCKDFIIKNCLTPTILFGKKLIKIKETLNLNNFNYSIIHIRLDDNEIFNHNRLNNILNIINSIKQNNSDEKYLLIASNKIYLNYINFPFIKKTNLKSGHVGLNTTTLNECEDTMIEFMLMTTCKKIYQLSVYGWGSGFSDTINKIYDIPVNKYDISSLNTIINKKF